MKKYVKPDLFYENFELSQHIAACGIDVNMEDINSCSPTLDPVFWGGLNDVVFGGEYDKACTLDINAIEVYCYTVGTNEAGKVFNS